MQIDREIGAGGSAVNFNIFRFSVSSKTGIYYFRNFFLAEALFPYSLFRYSCSEIRRFNVKAGKETTAHKSNNIPVVTYSSFYRQIKREATWLSEYSLPISHARLLVE